MVHKREDFPSYIVNIDGEVVVGPKAQLLLRAGQERKISVTRELKRRMDRDEEIEVPVGKLFRALLGGVLEEFGLKCREQGIPLTEIEGIVIGVPNDFGIRQRWQIREAAAGLEILGLKGFDVQLLSEPTAAAIGFQGQCAAGEELLGRTLICDFGGGTTDISVGYWESTTSFRLEHTWGDTHRGGLDIDTLFVTDIIKPHYIQKTGEPFPTFDRRSKEHMLVSLSFEEEAQRLKEALSKANEMTFPFVHALSKLEGERFHRREFEQKVDGFLRGVIEECKKNLDDFRRREQPVEHVLAVGGSILIPRFRKGIESLCAKYNVKHHFPDNPIDLVGSGLAYYVTGKDYKIDDCFNHNVAFATRSGKPDIIIRKGEKWPHLGTKTLKIEVALEHDVGTPTTEAVYLGFRPPGLPERSLDVLYLVLQEEGTKGYDTVIPLIPLDLRAIGSTKAYLAIHGSVEVELRFDYGTDTVELVIGEMQTVQEGAPQYVSSSLVEAHQKDDRAKLISRLAEGKLEVDAYVRHLDRYYRSGT